MGLARGALTFRLQDLIPAIFLLVLTGCRPEYATSTEGLIGPLDRAAPFSDRYVGEWYGPTWESVEWKVERWTNTDHYVVTRRVGKEEFTLRGSVVKAGNPAVMDLQGVSSEGRATGLHMIVKIEYSILAGLVLGDASEDEARRTAKLGGGPFVRYRKLTLRPLMRQYFLDHPGLVESRETFDEHGKSTGLVLTSSPEILRVFLEAHGEDEGLWADDDAAFRLEGK
jgi:hypothetical protein